MTQEEKAKRYDEKLDVARHIYADPSVKEEDKYYIEVIFPELSEESEDERIRKWIIGVLSTYEHDRDLRNAAIAWLEKLCEHKKFRDSIQVGDKVTRNEDGVLVNLSQLNRVAKPADKQGEQKPAEWSEEDKKVIDDIEWALIDKRTKEKCPIKYEEEINWLKSLKEKMQPQPKQKWTEEDDSKLKEVLYYIEYVNKTNVTFQQRDLVHLINWLKSLRPQNTWKPSDEQMRVLDLAIRCGINKGTTEETTLVSLFNDLKKLKE